MLFDRDTFERQGMTFRVQFEPDYNRAAPWEEEDGHGPVSDWRRADYYSRPRKRAGERVLISDHGAARFYDFQEACKIALRDGWGVPLYKTGTKRQQAAWAVEADFQRLRAWCNDEWSYVGVVVELLDDEGDPLGETESLWGIESDAYAYLEEVAGELADAIISRLGHAGASANGGRYAS